MSTFNGYIGALPVPLSVLHIEEHTTTSGQKTFYLDAEYEPGYILVELDGSGLQTSSYTATDGTTLVLDEGATEGQILKVTSFGVFTPQGRGGGFFKGNRGNSSVDAAAGDIFRINAQTLTKTTTIDSDENASCAGPLALDSNVDLIINGNLVIN